jgi:hypothetical protein
MVDSDFVTCADLASMEFPPLSPEPVRFPTWAELCDTEPKLRDVERLAIALRGNDWRHWGQVKRAFLPLAGFTASRYELRNTSAYDVVYDHLLKVWEAIT